MSNQESKSKKELSDKELQKATGGADFVPGDGGVSHPSPDSATVVGWTDEEGVFHEGAAPDSVTTADPNMIAPYSEDGSKMF